MANDANPEILRHLVEMNQKLNTLGRVEEKIFSIVESLADLKSRLHEMEIREREQNYKVDFAYLQAKEFSKIKEQITANKTFGATMASTVKWVSGIFAAIVVASMLSEIKLYKEPEQNTQTQKTTQVK